MHLIEHWNPAVDISYIYSVHSMNYRPMLYANIMCVVYRTLKTEDVLIYAFTLSVLMFLCNIPNVSIICTFTQMIFL